VQSLGHDSSFTRVRFVSQPVYQMSAEEKPFNTTVSSVENVTNPTAPVAKFTQKNPASRLKTDTMVGIDDSRKGNSLRLPGMGLAPIIYNEEPPKR
jgi:hypothetical protein